MPRKLTGRGTKIYLFRQGNDPKLAANPATITAGASAAANATSISTVTVDGTNVDIRADTPILFVNPTTGAEKYAVINQTVTEASTSLTVFPLEKAIENGDIAYWPPILGGRTSANIDSQGQREANFTFEDGGYEDGVTVTQTNQVTMEGNFSGTDPGYQFAARNPFDPVRIRVEFPPDNVGDTVVTVVEGEFSVTSRPRNIQTTSFIQSSITGSFNGEPVETREAPLAYP